MKKLMVAGMMIAAMAMLAGCPTIDQSLVGQWQGETEAQANMQPAPLDQVWEFTDDCQVQITSADISETDPYTIVDDKTAPFQMDLTVPTETDDQTETVQCIYKVDTTTSPATLTLAVGTTTTRPTDFTVSASVELLTFTKK